MPSVDTVSFDGVGDDGLLQVSISDAALRDRPPTMTEREAQLAVQQVVYTVQGAVQARAPVQFLLDGNPVDTVLGVPTAEPLAERPAARRALPRQHHHPRAGRRRPAGSWW